MQDEHPIQILIACDFAVLRSGLRLLVDKEEGFEIIGEASSINEIFETLRFISPDLILINLNLEADSLNSLCKNIHSKYPRLPILVFMKDSMEISLAELIVSGVRGVIWEENSDLELINVIRCVGTGKLYFEDPENCKLNCHLSHKICDHLQVNDFSSLLSVREIEVLRLIGKGFTYKKIADKLCISSRTVESHKNNILTKLNIKNKYGLIKYSLENLKT